MRPERDIDPYIVNDIKGTRMPDYSGVARERDVYGELGWVPNFAVTFSKNNTRLHNTYKEFFDQPKNYHLLYSSNSMTVSEFFRANAPSRSVAKSKPSDPLSGS